MYTLENISQLLDALNACRGGIFEYGDVINAAKLEPSKVLELVKWDSQKYTRIILEKNKDFELILICWEPGQESAIHNHNGQQGWINIIQGELIESLYTIPVDGAIPILTSKNNLRPGVISYIRDDMGIHKISNSSNQRCISLHLYVKPLDVVGIIHDETGEVSKITLDSIK